jgi:hypothetical protein
MIFAIPLKEVVDSFYAADTPIKKAEPPKVDETSVEKRKSFRFKKVLETISIPRGDVYK